MRVGGVRRRIGGAHFTPLMIQAMPIYLLNATKENLIFLFGEDGPLEDLFHFGIYGSLTIDQALNHWRPNVKKHLRLTPEAIEKYQISFPEELYNK